MSRFLWFTVYIGLACNKSSDVNKALVPKAKDHRQAKAKDSRYQDQGLFGLKDRGQAQ